VRSRPFESAEAFESLYKAHAPDVLAFCLRRALPSAAEDALAETFAVAWRRRCDIPEHAVPWLLGVSRRVLANQRRTSRRMAALAERLSLERPAAAALENAADPVVLSALAALPAKDQEVLLLAAWEELTSRDAGRVLGCTATAYRIRLLRARRRLARSLEPVDGSVPNSTAWRIPLETKEMQS
jgi:RNA polymerase sigma-70 factor (ECF subfamily)